MFRARGKLAWFLPLAVAIFVTQQIYRWGGPVPIAHRQAIGRPLPPPTGGGRQLIVCLDGVPFAEMEALWRNGRFRDFFAPSRLISTFPADSEVALTAILQAPAAPGYENLYFDRVRGRLAGGIRVTLAQSAPYLRRQHYDEPAIFKGIHFILPLKSFRADLGRLRKRFLAAHQPLFVAHLSSTDALYHVRNPEFARARLMEVEAVLRDICLESGGQLRVLLYSDHGNNLIPSRRAPLQEALEQNGFRLGDSLERPRTVVIPAFGLVNFAPVYARANEKSEVAHILAKAEGVELVVYPEQEDDDLMLLARSGRARLRWRNQGARSRYEAESGDPLRLSGIWKRLPTDSEGYASEADLFAATLAAPYPDAPYRLYDWSHNHVRNRADIVVSLAGGYHYGSRLFEKLVSLSSTHGGLEAGSSVGFAMSNSGPLPAALRYNELWTQVQGRP